MNGNVVPAPLAQRLAELPREAALRLALGLDAAITGTNGVAYVALAGVLDSPLGLDETLLRGAGAALIAFSAALALLATRRQIPATAVAVVVVANGVWALDSIAALALGWIEPTTGGAVWVALQAVVVAGFAALQYAALRRPGAGR